MKRERVSVLALLACIVSNAAPASALCVSGVPLCQSFWSYETVFEGTVVRIDQKTADDPATPFKDMPERFRPPFRIVTFEVLHSWRGDRGPRIGLTLAGGSGVWVEDSVDYVQGGHYLVFAYRVPADSNILSTSACAPGTHVGSMDATEIRAFLETISQPSSGGRVFGGVYDASAQVPGQRLQPSVEAGLVLKGEGIDRAQTAAKGTFSFTGLKPGTYTLAIDVPPGFKPWDPVVVTIDDPHACVARSFYLHHSLNSHDPQALRVF